MSRAVRTPSIVEHYGRVLMARYPVYFGNFHLGDGSASFVGNPDFDSEVVNAYEAGYRWQATSALIFDLALFYNEYDKIYTYLPTRSGFDVNNRFINGQSGSGEGFELAADWKVTSWLSLALAYAYLETDLTTDAYVGSQAGGSSWVEKASPKNQGSLRASIALAPDWRLNLWARYVDSIVCQNSSNLFSGEPYILDDYFTLNANLIWTPIKNLELMLAGQNLTNSGQLQYASEYQTPATEIERAIYGKLTWRF